MSRAVEPPRISHSPNARALNAFATDLAGVPRAMNAASQIVGNVGDNTTNSAQYAFLWRDGAYTLLRGLQGRFSGAYDYGFAYDINDAGQIVGGTQYNWVRGNATHAVIWENGSPRDLGVLPPGGSTPNSSSMAFGVNHQGQVVGESEYNGNVRHAVLWSNGSIKDLGTLAGPSAALEINNGGEIAGWSTASDGRSHAVVWRNGLLTDLGPGRAPPLTTPATSSASWAWNAPRFGGTAS